MTVVVLVVIVICLTVVSGLLYARLVEKTTTVPESVTSVYPFPTTNTTSTISATVGEIFAIQLNSNAGSTGFDWNVSCSEGIQYLNYTVISTSPLIGGPQVRYYFFHALTAGSQTITLRDMRPFAPYEVAATINIQLNVS